MKTTLWLAVLSLALTTGLMSFPARAGDLELQSGDRVVVLGGTFFERMQAYGLGEAALMTGYADRDISVRNLGWSGDNVFGEARAVFGSVEDGFKRLEKDVRAARPTVVIVNYGGNEAHSGSDGLAAFQAGLQRLLDMLASTQARIIVLLPHSYEDLGGDLPSPEAYNQDLELYRGALRDASERRQLPVVDLARALQAARGDLGSNQSLTDNGVHLSPLGYRAVAPHLATSLGATQPAWHVELDLRHNAMDAVGCMVLAVSTGEAGQVPDDAGDRAASAAGNRPTRVEFTVLDDVLELSQQNGYGSPATLPQGKLAIGGLAKGDYALKIDGQTIRTDSEAAWSQGLPLTQRGGQKQAEQLRQAVVAKNQLYFYRYRPQNETYLFLFRKHEQGNNAAEIPQFDPLIQKQEQRIAGLRRPRPRKFEVVRVRR